jgi:hypothetical protein
MTFDPQNSPRHPSTVVCGLVAIVALTTNTAVAQEPSPAAPVTPSSRVTVSPAQVDAMAELFQAPREEVVRRLWLDPGLAPLALRALERGQSRRTAGKVLTICGWVVLGVGEAVGALLLLNGYAQSHPFRASDCDGACQSSATTKETVGIVLAIASLPLGLGLALPGMGILRQPSSLESDALRRFQGSDPDRLPPAPSPSLPPAPVLGRALSLPLLGFNF